MGKIIAVVCLGFLAGVALLMGEDAPNTASGMKDDAIMRGALPKGGVQMVSEYLLQNDPKKLEEMKRLRLENPEEFEKQLTEISQKMREEARKEAADLKAAADKYRETKSDADKAALKARLADVMGKRIKMQKRNIEETEAKLARLKTELAEEEKKVQAQIDEKISAVLLDKGGL